MKLDHNQLAAVNGIVESRNKITVIAGSAGRGKTTIVQAAVEALLGNGVDPEDIHFCGPTGKCCYVLNAMLPDHLPNRPKTIHMMLGCQGPTWMYNPANRFPCKYLFIEECSMVDSALLARVISSISEDARIILSGDNKQLFPVQAGCPFADIIKHGPSELSHVLQVNYRQLEGSMIADACEAVIAGKRVEYAEPSTPDRDMFLHEEKDNEEIPAIVASIVKPWFDEKIDFAVLVPQRPGKVGLNALNKYLQENLNPGGASIPIYDFRIKKGDRIRVIKNNYALQIFNGAVGTVTRIDTEDSRICAMFDGGREITFEKADIKHLVLSYAQTIHSVQGSEYQYGCVVCDKSHTYMWSKALAYVAVSRFKKELHVVGQRKTMARAVAKDISDERNTFLKEKLQIPENFEVGEMTR